MHIIIHGIFQYKERKLLFKNKRNNVNDINTLFSPLFDKGLKRRAQWQFVIPYQCDF